MTPRANRFKNPPATKPASGPGMSIPFMCMGCNRPRNQAGSKGRGLRLRCAVCVAGEQAKAGAAA